MSIVNELRQSNVSEECQTLHAQGYDQRQAALELRMEFA